MLRNGQYTTFKVNRFNGVQELRAARLRYLVQRCCCPGIRQFMNLIAAAHLWHNLKATSD